MRWLALGLLALNLVHYGWRLDQDTRRARANHSQALTLPARVEGLTLVRELAEAPAGAEALGHADGLSQFESGLRASAARYARGQFPGHAPRLGLVAEARQGLGDIVLGGRG